MSRITSGLNQNVRQTSESYPSSMTVSNGLNKRVQGESFFSNPDNTTNGGNKKVFGSTQSISTNRPLNGRLGVNSNSLTGNG